MGNTRGTDATDSALPASITLTTDHVTADDVGPLVAALHAVGVYHLKDPGQCRHGR